MTIYRSLTTAKVPAHVEPQGLNISDGKRSDGLTMVPWKSGRLLVWDATCPDNYAPSYISQAVSGVGEVVARAKARNAEKYSKLGSSYIFTSMAIETSGVVGPRSPYIYKGAELLPSIGH